MSYALYLLDASASCHCTKVMCGHPIARWRRPYGLPDGICWWLVRDAGV